MSLRDYIKGKRKGRDARGIELEAMRDPLLAEALEGFDSVEGDHEQAVRRLRTHVEVRSGLRRRKIIRWSMSAVAAVALASGVTVWFLTMLGGDNILKRDIDPLTAYAIQNNEYAIGRPEEMPDISKEIENAVEVGKLIGEDRGGMTNIGNDAAREMYGKVKASGNGFLITSVVNPAWKGIRGEITAEVITDRVGEVSWVRVVEKPEGVSDKDIYDYLVRLGYAWPADMTFNVKVRF